MEMIVINPTIIHSYVPHINFIASFLYMTSAIRVSVIKLLANSPCDPPLKVPFEPENHYD